MTRLTLLFRQRPKGGILVVSVVVVAAVAWIDWATGPELRFYLFYWPPIAAATWYAGRRWGLTLVVASSLAWLLANVGEPGSQKVPVVLWNGAVNLTSFALLPWLIAHLRVLVERERTTARTDAVTGVPNLRAFMELLAQSCAAADRAGQPLTLAFVDLDDFKVVNDRFGHTVGDQALHTVASTIRASLRASDIVARLGGDEFAILLPQTDLHEARSVLNRVHLAMRSLAEPHGWPVSASIGAVTTAGHGSEPRTLLLRADAVMYEVKAAGKNGLRMESVEPSSSGPPAGVGDDLAT